MAQDEIADVGRMNRAALQEIRLLCDEERAFFGRVGDTAMRALDQGGIERNDIEQGSEPKRCW